MSNKEPLLTRAKIREMNKEKNKLAKLKDLEIRKEYEGKQKAISKEFKQENKAFKTVKGSRSEQIEKRREQNSFLNKAIIIVVLLLIILFLVIKYI
ncbi:cell wall synthase accessory phosphoprotein MacP [Vagococcus salmoninarum]|uniref:Uncharacterized protein n=1 Tax=Vagococcus salmoninarum TaxID=2739 RepID=A0A429ZCZ5_9ENTE|nr:cell wall synthase accessory phosphoprotein MacP [Vagococcus salmoninarum]MBE9387761.1 hypothetical protein [Vagococcus salmoninarum]RST91578.1 hypothetical protein CBF35_14025 [Vagococcus salmoninarum]